MHRIYENPANIEFDPDKDAANVAKHGVSLTRTAELDIVAVVESSRPEQNENRFRLYGSIDDEAYRAVVTYRKGACGRSACDVRTG